MKKVFDIKDPVIYSGEKQAVQGLGRQLKEKKGIAPAITNRLNNTGEPVINDMGTATNVYAAVELAYYDDNDDLVTIKRYVALNLMTRRIAVYDFDPSKV